MATTLLYHRDPHLLTFTAGVVAHGAHQGRPSVILDETAFYPEAGGQMADRGQLGGRAILDVQVDDDGVVHHVVDGALPDVGARVDGAVDGPRRRQHMAQHTAQHMLSAALLVGHGKAETVSSRLGESVCTIDVDVPALSERSLQEAEDLVNARIDDDVAVTAFFPDAAQLAALPLRRRPKVSENIRVVVVGDVADPFDVSPCGGTHVTRTGQIGLVRVTGVEKYKGMTRVSFQAGPRARREAFSRAGILEALGRSLSSTPEEVPGALEKLRATIKGLQADKAALATRVGTLLGEALAARAGKAGVVVGAVEVAVEVVDGADMELLRAVAARAVALAPGLAVVVAGKDADGGGNVIVSRGASSTVDCGALLKRLVAAHGGKGGGKADSAQGRLGVVDSAALGVTVAAG